MNKIVAMTCDVCKCKKCFQIRHYTLNMHVLQLYATIAQCATLNLSKNVYIYPLCGLENMYIVCQILRHLM